MAIVDTSDSGASTTLDYLGSAEDVPRRLGFSFGARSHAGKVRKNNEDHFLVARLAKSMQVCKSSLPDDGTRRCSDEEGYLMVVADGIGGAAGGDRARPALAVSSLEALVNSFKWFLHLGRQEQSELFDELRQCLERADHEVIKRAERDHHLEGMGTTLTMAYSIGEDLFIAHAGDSRAYLFRDGSLEQVTRDHTYVQMLVNLGQLSPEQARQDRRRYIVTNVIGGAHEGVQAEVHRLRLIAGDVLLLCSDGLSDPLGDAEIAAVLAQTADPTAACDCLIEQALDHGGPDNVTAIVAL